MSWSETCQGLDGCERMGLDDKFAIAMVKDMAKQNTTTCCWSHMQVECWWCQSHKLVTQQGPNDGQQGQLMTTRQHQHPPVWSATRAVPTNSLPSPSLQIPPRSLPIQPLSLLISLPVCASLPPARTSPLPAHTSMIPLAWYGFIGMVWFHWYGMVSLAWYDSIGMVCFYLHDIIPLVWYASVSMV